MTNVSFKAFMWDLREEGLFYAIKTTVWWLNPYAQLREAHAWLDTYREVIEGLSEELTQLKRDKAEAEEWGDGSEEAQR
jgi:hypothetical protein